MQTTTIATSATSATARIRPQLEEEWAVLRHRRTACLQASSWQITEVAITDLDQLLTLAGLGTAATASTEAVLRELVVRGRSDDLAARIALQRVLPGLMASVSRRRGPDGHTDVLEELVGAAWITIRTFDPQRRPSCLAAAIVRGAEHRGFKSAERRRSATETCADPAAFDWHPHRAAPTALDELDLVLTEAGAHGVDAADLDFVRQLVAYGSTRDLAAQLGVTARTIRNRRDRITYRLRQSALAA